MWYNGENNRWVTMSQCIPWGALAEGCYQGLSTTQGRPSKDARLIIGAVIISVKLTYAEIDTLAGFYARQIAEFLSKKAAHLDYKRIRLMLDSGPSEIKSKLPSALISNARSNVKAFLLELRSMIRK